MHPRAANRAAYFSRARFLYAVHAETSGLTPLLALALAQLRSHSRVAMRFTHEAVNCQYENNSVLQRQDSYRRSRQLISFPL